MLLKRIFKQKSNKEQEEIVILDIIQDLDSCGFFRFEKAEGILSEDLFPSLKNLNISTIIESLLKLKKIEFKSEKAEILETRILYTLKQITFWIDRQKVIKMIQYKR